MVPSFDFSCMKSNDGIYHRLTSYLGVDFIRAVSILGAIVGVDFIRAVSPKRLELDQF